MSINSHEFKNIPHEEKRKYIQNHEWFMGLERAKKGDLTQKPIGFNKASQDFYENILINHDKFEDFLNISYREKRKHIQDHEWFMGINRNKKGNLTQKPIGYGNAALDYLEKFLGINLDNCPRILYKLEDKLYHHCVNCGSLFKDNFEKENKIGNLPKILGVFSSLFSISSSLCKGCYSSHEKNPSN
jgi:hypothetical protein